MVSMSGRVKETVRGRTSEQIESNKELIVYEAFIGSLIV